MFYNFNNKMADTLWGIFTKAQKEKIKHIKSHLEFISDEKFSEKLSFTEFLTSIYDALSKITSLKQTSESYVKLNDRWNETNKNLNELNAKIYHLNESDKKSLEKIETYDLIDKFFKNPTIDHQYGIDALVIWLEHTDRISVSRYKVEKENDDQPIEYAFGCYPVKSFYKKQPIINPNKLIPLETKAAYNFSLNKALKALIEKE